MDAKRQPTRAEVKAFVRVFFATGKATGFLPAPRVLTQMVIDVVGGLR